MLMLGLYNGAPSSGGTLLLNAAPYARSCQVTTDELGFERLTAAIRQALYDSFRMYDAPLLYLGLVGNGQIVWEGRLEDPTLSVGAQGSGLTAQALGYWRALSDTPSYLAFWSKSTVTGFRPVLTTEIATSQPDRFSFNAQNQIMIMPQKGATFGNTGAAKQAYYAFSIPVPAANGRSIEKA